MTAVCKGAKEAGGTTIGILPGEDPNDANPWVDIPVPTGIGHARKRDSGQGRGSPSWPSTGLLVLFPKSAMPSDRRTP